MPESYCFLCASDEGVFLDITTDNKQVFQEQFEICSLAKVFTIEQLPIKLCHKCAYELVQCSSFLQKYKQSIKRRSYLRRNCCSFCLEASQNQFIFDLNKDKSLQYNLLNKLQIFFNYEPKEICGNYKFICLSCRYILDVLLDLKNVSEEISVKLKDSIYEEIDYATFSKVETTVVSRKTTIIESARTSLNILQGSDNNLVTMTRTRSQNNKSHNNKLKNTNISMSEAEKQVQQNISETKLCTVYLKDVLKDTDIKEQKLYKINEDNVGNKKFVVTDKNMTNENKPGKAVNNTRKQGLKRSVRNMKVESEDTNNEDFGPTKKHKPDVKGVGNADSKTESISKIRKVRQLKKENNTHSANQSSDSDSSVPKTMRKSARTLTKHKLVTGSSWSDADIDNRQERKKLKTILKGIPITKSIQVSDVSSSNEEVVTRRTRLRFTSASSSMIDEIKNKTVESTVTKVSARKTKNSFKQRSTPSAIKTGVSQSESDDKEVIFVTKTYVCDECGASYENQLLGLTHKLSHYKQPTLKLQKLRDENLTVEKESGTSEAVDNLSEDPSESIALVVEDDEEELAESVKNLNQSNFTDISSNEENKACSPTKEIVEDAVDMKLVMKESDDDQVDKIQKNEEELQENKDTETNVATSSTQNEDETTIDEDERKGKKKDENVNLEENHDTVQSQTEHKEKHEESEQENNKNKLDDEEEVQDISLYDIDGERAERDAEKKNEERKSISETMEEENDKTKEEESSKTNDEENDRTKEDENDRTKKDENDRTKEDENERTKEDENDRIRDEENNRSKEEKNNDKDLEEGKEQELETGEGQDVKTIEDTEKEDVVCESSINSVKDSADSTVNVDKVDSLKETEQDNPELIEVESEIHRTIDIDDLQETTEQKSPKRGQKVKSSGESTVQTKVNSSPKQSKVVKEVELIEDDDDTTDKNEMDNSRGKSATDSANSVVEILEVENEIDRTIDTGDSKETTEKRSPRSAQKLKSSGENAVQTKVNSSPKRSKVVEEIELIEEGNMIEQKGTDNSKEGKLTIDSANAVAEVLEEVLDLANAEVQKRQEVVDTNAENDSVELETLENISREINNTIDMPSLKINDDNSKNVVSLE
ncbi:hypothetical protein ANTPLA_LOCUS1067 [Anthophora plagiata]